MAAPKHKKVNLLIREGFEHSALGKTLSWVLSIGRTIVIFTELVVIIAFLSRFWLDRMHTDLIGQNNTKKTQIQASGQFEKDFRSAQLRLAAYQALESSRLSPAKLIKDVSPLLPIDVTLTEFSINKGKLDVRGTALSEAGLAGFIKALENSGKYKDIKLGDISLQTGGQKVIAFLINGEANLSEIKKGEKNGSN